MSKEVPRQVVARRLANRRIGFIGHAIVCALGCLLVYVAAGLPAAAIVGIGWLIALATHGFFGVLAPVLRERWIAEDLAKNPALPSSSAGPAQGEQARALAELSASIAHEIRNPITAAKSLVQQILESPAAPENAEYAKVAVEELDRVERSISHLLRFAREEKPQLSEVRLDAPVRAALSLHAERFERDRVAVDTDLEDAGTVQGDAEQLRRVLSNLLDNALDALAGAHVASPRITVSAGQNLARTENWVMVADNGPGIPEEALSKIFTPFFTGKAHGTGLGLALCKKIVTEHGGRIEVKSAPSSGTEMCITLPASSGSGGAS